MTHAQTMLLVDDELALAGWRFKPALAAWVHADSGRRLEHQGGYKFRMVGASGDACGWIASAKRLPAAIAQDIGEKVAAAMVAADEREKRKAGDPNGG